MIYRSFVSAANNTKKWKNSVGDCFRVELQSQNKEKSTWKKIQRCATRGANKDKTLAMHKEFAHRMLLRKQEGRSHQQIFRWTFPTFHEICEFSIKKALGWPTEKCLMRNLKLLCSHCIVNSTASAHLPRSRSRAELIRTSCNTLASSRRRLWRSQ